MNYGNRNASSTYTLKDLGFGYSMAVISSISVALTLKKLFASQTKGLSSGKTIAANAVISYIAVACAGFLNNYCMRYAELGTGI